MHVLLRDLIESIAGEEGAREGVTAAQVLGAAKGHRAVRARKRAWLRLLGGGYPVLHIADTWGCDRRSIQRARDAQA